MAPTYSLHTEIDAENVMRGKIAAVAPGDIEAAHEATLVTHRVSATAPEDCLAMLDAAQKAKWTAGFSTMAKEQVVEPNDELDLFFGRVVFNETQNKEEYWDDIYRHCLDERKKKTSLSVLAVELLMML